MDMNGEYQIAAPRQRVWEALNDPEVLRQCIPGCAKGGAAVKLIDQGAGTLLSYTVKAQVGGKLAQIGSRLIDGASRKLADEFFACFAAMLSAPAADEAATAVAAPSQASAAADAATFIPPAAAPAVTSPIAAAAPPP